MKNVTNFRKTVESGVDPHLLISICNYLYSCTLYKMDYW